MNVLILSYACSPREGSEYEVGWKVSTTLARRYPKMGIYVVTRRKGEDLHEDTNLPNLHFLYYESPEWLCVANERMSRWGEQWNYLVWQIAVSRFIKKWQKTANVHIDVVHHLTYNQYRTPSPGYWMDVPFVVGPIGGAELINPVFYQDLDKHTLFKEKIRVQGWDRNVFKWYLSRRDTKKVVLCSCAENVERLKSYAGDAELLLMPAIGIDDELKKSDVRDEKQAFTIVCACKALDWKGLFVFLKAVHLMKQQLDEVSFIVKLVGIRFDGELKRVQYWLEECELQNNVEVIPFMEREDLFALESTSDLFVYPAFRDSGSMSVLEACALGCPTICFDAGGQDVFPDDVLLKVPVSESYDSSLHAFADKLVWAYRHPAELKPIGSAAQQWVKANLTWNKKVDAFVQIYQSLTSH